MNVYLNRHFENDQEYYAFAALNDSSRQMREVATKRLDDQDVLERIALYDSEPYVREAAIVKLNDRDILKKISVEDDCRYNRLIASERRESLTEDGVFYW